MTHDKAIKTIREALKFYAEGDWNGISAKQTLAALDSLAETSIRDCTACIHASQIDRTSNTISLYCNERKEKRIYTALSYCHRYVFSENKIDSLAAESKPVEPSEDIAELVKKIRDDRYGVSFIQAVSLVTALVERTRRESFVKSWDYISSVNHWEIDKHDLEDKIMGEAKL